jgi:AraC-like DNA-binding protein
MITIELTDEQGTMRYVLQIQDWERLAKEANFQPQVMAAMCPISLRQLERFFKKDLQKTPSQWVRDLRCRLAFKLISTGWSSKAVAAELHYWDESHFCREFKRVYRASPQTFAPGFRHRPSNGLGTFLGTSRPGSTGSRLCPKSSGLAETLPGSKRMLAVA